jgi:putative chitinase
MIKVTKKLLRAMGASASNTQEYLPALREQLPMYGIDSRLRVAHFLSQVFHESGCLRYDTENLNYSAKALRSVFRKYFPTDALAEEYARRPSKIANRVYANRMGNGGEAGGDGWKHRGRGLIQLTGKNNYSKFHAWMANQFHSAPGKPGRTAWRLRWDVANYPDLVATDYGVHSAVFYWDTNNLNRYADNDDCRGLTRRINGGKNGLEHRQQLLALALDILDA